MKQLHQLFYIYTVFLLFFFWRTADFWLNNRYGDVKNAGILLYIGLVGVELITLHLILSSPSFNKHDYWIHRLCLLWEAVMLFVLIYNKDPFVAYFKCLAWPLFFESAYLFVRWNYNFLKSFRKVYYLLVFGGAVIFFRALFIRSFGSQTNMIYFMLLPVPVIFLFQKRKIRNVILVFMTFFAFLSMKRSMLLAIVLFWGLVGFKYLFERGKRTMAIVLVVIIAATAYGSFRVVDNVSSGYLSSRLVTDEDTDITNGRELIYTITWNMIEQSSPMHLIFGHGHNAVRSDSILNISAHNEFLEIIYDYGIVIFLLYLGLWVYVIRQWLYHYSHDTTFFIPYTLSICIFAVMAMVSELVIYVSYFLYLVMFWGMVGAAKEIDEIKQNI